MKDSPHKRRRNHRLHVTDEDVVYEYNPAELLYGIGSGRIREGAGGENAERVAAAIVLEGMRESALGALLGALTVDELIASARLLVDSGALSANGVGPAPEFN